MNLLRKGIIGTWLPMLLVIIWQVAEPSVFFPRPSDIFLRLLAEFDGEWLEENLYPTIRVFLLGYLLGISTGVILGTAVGSWSRIYSGAVPILTFFRKIPSVAKFPLVMAIIGIGLTSQIFAVALSVSLMMSLVIAKIVHEPAPNVVELGKLFKLSRRQAIYHLFIPNRLNEIWTVAKSAIQVALLVTIFSETIGSGQGLGALTIRAKSLFDIELMWVGILVVGMLSVLIHQAFEIAQRFFLPRQFERKLS